MTFPNIKNLVILFLITIACIGITCFFRMKTHPAWSGLVAVMPISLLTLWYIEDKYMKDFSFSVALSLLGCSISIFVFYYLYNHLNTPKHKAVFYSLLTWFLFIIIAYIFFTHGPYTYHSLNKSPTKIRT